MLDHTLPMPILGLLALIVVLVVIGILRGPLRCPRCSEPAPKVRLPKSLRQAMLGGSICSKCGQEYDRRGQAVGSSPS
jgi:hypothetical protein